MDPQTLIQTYLDGELTKDQFAALSAWLEKSEANREAFVQATNLDNDIYRELAQDDLSRFLDKVDINAVYDALRQSPDDSTAAMLSITDPQVQVNNQQGKDQEDELTLGKAVEILSYEGLLITQQALRRYAVPLSLAAAVTLAFIIALPFIGNDNQPDQPDPLAETTEVPATIEEAPTPTPVATLTHTHNAQWAGPASAAPARGSKLHPNDRLTLTAGFAEITTAHGAVAILEAPATIEFTDHDNALRLHAGTIVGICETESSKGFLVHTPHTHVTDIGTRFGIQTNADATEVHVLEGEVLVAQSDAYSSTPAISLLAGQSVRQLPDDPAIERIAYQTQAFETLLANAGRPARTDSSLAYTTFVESLDPLAWWSFDQLDDGRIVDRGRAGAHTQAINNQPLFGSPRHHAIAMDGSLGPIRLASSAPIDLVAGFSIEAWVRVDSPTQPSSRIFSNRSMQPVAGVGLGLHGSDLAEIATCIDLDGASFKAGAMSVKFSLFGVYDLISEPQVPAGEWTHVVAVCPEDAPARLYINGNPVRAGVDVTSPLPAYASWMQAASAKASDQVASIGRSVSGQPEPFVGGIDELIIYEKTLGAEQISRLYQLGNTTHQQP